VLAVQTVVNVHPVLHGEGYEWGWSFWVALGTLTLAAATGVLAWKTRAVAAATGTVALETKQLARETTELAKRTSEDVAAQFRPVLIPSTREDLVGGVKPLVVLDSGTVHCFVVNDGRGPALDVSAIIMPGGILSRPQQTGTVPVATIAQLTFENVPVPTEQAELVIRYRDLGENGHTTTLSVRVIAGKYVIVRTAISSDPP
jgi:hypothetical protein